MWLDECSDQTLPEASLGVILQLLEFVHDATYSRGYISDVGVERQFAIHKDTKITDHRLEGDVVDTVTQWRKMSDIDLVQQSIITKYSCLVYSRLSRSLLVVAQLLIDCKSLSQSCSRSDSSWGNKLGVSGGCCKKAGKYAQERLDPL